MHRFRYFTRFFSGVGSVYNARDPKSQRDTCMHAYIHMHTLSHSHMYTYAYTSAKDVKTGGYPAGVGPTLTKGTAQFLCIRATGELNAPLEKVYGLFLNNDYVLDYNELCQVSALCVCVCVYVSCRKSLHACTTHGMYACMQ